MSASGESRWMEALLRRVLPDGPVGEAILGDLREERARRRDARGAAAARWWFLRQATGVALWAILDRARGRRWPTHGRGPGAGAPGGAPGPFASLGGELRAAVRGLLRSPGYAAAVVATLALALGSTVTVFTVVRGVLLRDLPFPEPDRVVRVDRLHEGQPREGSVSFPDYRDWQEEVASFSTLAFWNGNQGTYAAGGVAEIWNGIGATVELFEAVGVPPLLGAIPEEEWIPGAELLVLSSRLWRDRFGADPGVVGRTVEFHGRVLRVVAVMPPGFAFPDASVDHWVPLLDTQYLERRATGIGRVVGRLAPGRSLEAARAELRRLVARIDAESGDWDEGVAVRSLREVEVQGVRPVLWILMAAVLGVLAVAVANVAGLALARVEARRRELAVRVSLGAGRVRLLRLLVSEQLALASVAGLLGAGLAFLAVPILMELAPATLPRREAIHLDPAVLFTAAALTVAVGLAAGLLPALRGARTRVIDAREAGRGASASRRSRTAHRGLAVLQVAGAVVLLSGAGLLGNSFLRLTTVDPGFQGERILTVELGLPRERYPDAEAAAAFYQALFESVEAIPGVVRAGTTTHLPFSRSRINLTTVAEGEMGRETADRLLSLEVVDGEYLGALGLTPVAGAPLPVAPDGPLRVAVLNQTAARRFFPGRDPVGRAFSFDAEEGRGPSPETLIRVLGVVPDVRRSALDEPPAPTAYVALADFRRYYGFITGRFGYLVVEVDGTDPNAALPAVREAVAALDPTLPLISVATLEERVSGTVAAERFRTTVLGAFALMAVLLALLGVYAVTSYGVRLSLRDLGIRMALGARANRVRREVLAEAARTALIGVSLGLAGALAAGPLLADLLYEVPARDPATLACVVLLAASACVVSAWVPAARASRVDPARVLRGE